MFCLSLCLKKSIVSKPSILTETPKPRLLFVRLLYVHLMSNEIRKEMNSFFQKPTINAKLILIDEIFNIGRFFTHKDKRHTLCRSNVVF